MSPKQNFKKILQAVWTLPGIRIGGPFLFKRKLIAFSAHGSQNFTYGRISFAWDLVFSHMGVRMAPVQHWSKTCGSWRQSWHCSPPQPRHLLSTQLETASALASLHICGGSTECQWSSQHVATRVESSRQSWHCSPPQPLQLFSMHVLTSSSQAHCRDSAPYKPSQGFLEVVLHMSVS